MSPTIDYLKQACYSNVGVIATKKTIESGFFEQMISSNVNLTLQACPKFVPIIEQNRIDSQECKDAVSLYLSEMKQKNVGALVMGCTHYPILIDLFREYLGDQVEFINMGKVLAKTVRFEKESKSGCELYFTKLSLELEQNVKRILNSNDPLMEVEL